MWPFKTYKSIQSSELFKGFTDWHSHLLPGVDDGVPTLEETLEILSEYEKLGVYSVWFTPHVMEDVPNEPDKLKKRFEEVKAAYSGPVKINLAAENMMDTLLKSRLDNLEVLPLGTYKNHLLIETSYFTPPVDLDEIIAKVKSKGFFPVLAHPERYVYMSEEDYDRLHANDVKFQLNIYSLVGMYGPEASDKARRLLKKGYYNLIGTDTHKLKQLKMAISRKALTSKDIQAVKELIKNGL